MDLSFKYICPEPITRVRSARFEVFAGELTPYIGVMSAMLKMFCAVLALSLAPRTVSAEGERAGEFDYYVLSLSWTPSWCELTGDARRDPQCDEGRGFGFTLHGLWPQFERGWPSYCRTTAQDPSRAETAAMANIMGGAGLAWHEWQKHGRCSGLSSAEYFAAARAAYEAVNRPEVLRQLPETMDIPPRVIEAAFLEVNPGLWPDALTVTCKAGMVQEIRICLTRDLEPRRCSADVARDCSARAVEMSPMR
jgi:ribonuclease T2